MRNLIFLLLICPLISGCSKPEEKDLIGTYEAKYSYGTEILTLNSDKTYEQTFQSYKEKNLKNSGSWDYDAATSRVRLTNIMAVDDFDKPAKNIGSVGGDWWVPVEKLFGSIRLNPNPDLPIKFIKKK